MSYKDRQVQWVTGHSGGSYGEIVAISMNSVLSFLLVLILPSSFLSGNYKFLLEYAIFCLPILLSYISSYFTIIYAIACAVLTIYFAKYETNLQEKIFELNKADGSMMLHTCSAILAVDFPLFPRRFAKVENFGISLMDVGVGCFVFSQGLIFGGRNYRRNSFGSSFQSTIYLLLLGLARLALTKGVDYQHHISEYGIHWNFFFTLALLPMIAYTVSSVELIRRNVFLIALLIILVYQFFLSIGGLENYILSVERDTFLSSNKEGICGLFGFSSLFFFSAKIGEVMFQQRDYRGWVTYLKHQIAFVCAGTVGYMLLEKIISPSRRMVNLTYVLVTVTFCMTLIVSCLIIQTLFPTRKSYQTLLLLHAINRNQLLGNVLTGLVNISMNTLDCSIEISFAILALYLLVLSTAAIIINKITCG